MQNFWLQQDGATAHTARETLLRAAFPGCLISRFGDVPWLPGSPDLLISFFMVILKEKVYCKRPNNIQELKTNIIDEINITPVLESVGQNRYSARNAYLLQ